MPNQNNFRTDLTTKTEPRFTVSRIVNVPDATILNEEVPASFAFDKDDNIEVHFYTAVSNQLILSTVINPNDDIIKSHIVGYNDGTYKNHIRIDFTKLFVDKTLILVPGDYRMVLNFFSNEIGSYTDRKLNIDLISNSRTEVQLSFNDTIDNISANENLYLLKEFVEKGFTKTDAIGVAEKIFVSGVQLENSGEGLTAQNVENNLYNNVNQPDEDIPRRLEVLGLKEIFDTQLNSFLVDMYQFIREEIVINSDERVQESEYQELIRTVIKQKIGRMQAILDKRIQVT